MKRIVLALVLSLAAAPRAHAQGGDATSDVTSYRVKQGDTLATLLNSQYANRFKTEEASVRSAVEKRVVRASGLARPDGNPVATRAMWIPLPASALAATPTRSG